MCTPYSLTKSEKTSPLTKKPKNSVIFLKHFISKVFISMICAVQSKNAVSASMKHNRYFHSTTNLRSIHYPGKRLYEHVFDMVDTAFSY